MHEPVNGPEPVPVHWHEAAAVAHDTISPLTFMFFISQVTGFWPVLWHIVINWVEHSVFACDRVATCVMPPENMVMTTSAVIRMTMAETTTANVVFMILYWLRVFINKGLLSQ